MTIDTSHPPEVPPGRSPSSSPTCCSASTRCARAAASRWPCGYCWRCCRSWIWCSGRWAWWARLLRQLVGSWTSTCSSACTAGAGVRGGVKRVRPECAVFTMQGDGDMANEGLQEVLHAAARARRSPA